MWQTIKHPESPSKLGVLLQDYPPFYLPFPDPGRITDKQAKTNLEVLLAQRQERLEITGRLLGEFGIETRDGFGDETLLDFFD